MFKLSENARRPFYVVSVHNFCVCRGQSTVPIKVDVLIVDFCFEALCKNTAHLTLSRLKNYLQSKLFVFRNYYIGLSFISDLFRYDNHSYYWTY